MWNIRFHARASLPLAAPPQESRPALERPHRYAPLVVAGLWASPAQPAHPKAVAANISNPLPAWRVTLPPSPPKFQSRPAPAVPAFGWRFAIHRAGPVPAAT